MQQLRIILPLLLFATPHFAQEVATFDDLSLPEDAYWDGSDYSGGFISERTYFSNVYSPDFGGFWSNGWAVSTQTDTLTQGFFNQFSAITGAGVAGSTHYAIAWSSAKLHFLDGPRRLKGAYVTNTTYAYHSMLEGDDFAKQFGGETGDDPDFFKIVIKKYLDGVLALDSVEFFLADFRASDPAEDYILDDWTYLDLSALGVADSLVIQFVSSDVGEYGINTPAYFAMDNLAVGGPFSPANGVAGAIGLAADSSIFVAWASGGEVRRGPMDKSMPSLGDASAGTIADALGKVGTNGTLSLGDGGQATLYFEQAIVDGEGWDFAVFENGFITGGEFFLELALVAVSSDGTHFVRFPARSLTNNAQQIGTFDTLDPSYLHNLAGKYPFGWGTPFDLAELSDSAGLDIQHISHVRVVDVVGSIDPSLGSGDDNGRLINDPFPTAFPSSGFDLDAIGVIHAAVTSTKGALALPSLQVFPNPVKRGSQLRLSLKGFDGAISGVLLDQLGRVCWKGVLDRVADSIPTGALKDGLYYLQLKSEGQFINKKIIVYE